MDCAKKGAKEKPTAVFLKNSEWTSRKPDRELSGVTANRGGKGRDNPQKEGGATVQDRNIMKRKKKEEEKRE